MALAVWIAEVRDLAHAYSLTPLQESVKDLEKAAQFLNANAKNPDALAAVAVPFLTLMGLVAGGAMLARSSVAAQAGAEPGFAAVKKATMEFFLAHSLAQTAGLSKSVSENAQHWLELEAAAL